MKDDQLATWYVWHKGRAKQGPYTLAQLLALPHSPGMRLRREGESAWQAYEGVCRTVPIVAIMGLVTAFDPLLLRDASFLGMVADPEGRRKLIVALDADRACTLTNYVADLAPRCAASPEELRSVVAPLLAEGDTGEWILSCLVDHSSMPEDVLFRLAEQGHCLSALGHRRGPRALLEFLAERHAYSEAITTLALHYYGGAGVGDEAFGCFVRRYRGCAMLRYQLRRAELSPEKKQAALEIIGIDEEDFQSRQEPG